VTNALFATLALRALCGAHAAPADRPSPSPPDVEAVRALEDAIKVSQIGGPGTSKIPNWDAASHARVR